MPILICYLFSGCMFDSGNDLLFAPKPPVDYVELQDKLNDIITNQMKPAAPESGENRNSVQLIDIDADGEQEAIAFFRSTKDTSLYKAYLFKKAGEGYTQLGSVEGYGLGINSVSYPRCGANGERSVVVCWRLGYDVNISSEVSVCRLENNVFKEVFNSGYSNMMINDLNGDGMDDMLLFVKEEKNNYFSVKFYEYNDSSVELSSETTLSADVNSIASAHTGYIAGFKKAVFIEGSLVSQGMVTDILTCSGSNIKNITVDSVSGISEETFRPVSTTCTDVDGDSIIEVPTAKALPGFPDLNGNMQWEMIWKKFAQDGSIAGTILTYHMFTEKWFLEIPPMWVDTVTVVKGRRMGQGYTAFIDASNMQPLIEVYAITGDARDSFAAFPEYKKIKESNDITYFVRIPDDAQGDTLFLKTEVFSEYFNLIPDEWIVSELL